MTGDQMVRSAYNRAGSRHDQEGGCRFRFPRKLIHELLCGYAWEEYSHVPHMVPAMRNLSRDAAMTRGTMRRRVPRGAVACCHWPRRRAQDHNSKRDQAVRIGLTQRLRNFHSFLFDQTVRFIASPTVRLTNSGLLAIRCLDSGTGRARVERKECRSTEEGDSGPKTPRTDSPRIIVRFDRPVV